MNETTGLPGFVLVLAVAAVASLVAGLTRLTPASEPLALTAAGIAVSFVPHVPRITLTPDVVLDGLLPPLLYAAAIRTSIVDLRRNRRPVLLLSVGLTAVSTVAAGVVAWLLVPAFTVAAGFALGAVVAPPDAVAATAVARRAGLPRRILLALSGESLVNDAVALVALDAAINAMSHSVQPWYVAARFVYSAVVGVLIGAAAAALAIAARTLLPGSVFGTVVSLFLPFAAFLPAQQLGASGVLAVVAAGLLLRVRSHRGTAQARLADDANWSTVEFVLESSVFLLIGLQLRRILTAVADDHVDPWTVAMSCLGVFATVILVRAAWTFAVTRLLRLTGRPSWDWRTSLVVSWAGMRGVVTLAAVFVLPMSTPSRDVAALVAFTVVAGSLFIQGSTLPRLIRVVGLDTPDPAADAVADANLLAGATRAGLAALDAAVIDSDPAEVVRVLRVQASLLRDEAFQRLERGEDAGEEIPAETRRRLRLLMLDAERAFILKERQSLRYDDVVAGNALRNLDIEASLLTSVLPVTERNRNGLLAEQEGAPGRPVVE